MNSPIEKDMVGFNEFDTRVSELIQTSLRSAELLGVSPEPTLTGYLEASRAERFIAYCQDGLFRRDLFEARLREKAVRVEGYHAGQWVERVVGERVSSQSAGPENADTGYPRFRFGEIDLDTSE